MALANKWEEMINEMNQEEDIPTLMSLDHTYKTFEKKWLKLPWIIRLLNDKTHAKMWFLAGTVHGMETLTAAAKKHGEETKGGKK